ncbi:MAG: hypothetical protein U0P45_03350 [Acidimicrobiales bacterium]
MVGSISRATVDDEVTTHAIIDLAVDTIDLGPSARIKTLHLSLDLNCAEDCNAVLSAGGALEVVLPTTSSGRVTVTVSGNLDLGKGTFDITGDLGQGFEAMKGVSVTGATLKVEGTEDGTSMTLTATGNVLGTMVAITIHLEADGSWAQATVTNWTPFDGAPTFQSLDVVYSKKARTVTLGSGKDLEVPADTVYLVADTTPPDWIHEVFHTDPTSTRVVVSGWVNLDSGDFGFDLAIELGNVEFEVDPVTMGLRKIALGMEKRGASVSFTVSADADLLLPPAEAGTPVDPLQFHLAATVNVTTSTLSGSLTLLRWDDAFGVQDLTVRNLTVAVSISPTSVVFGLGGTVTLPDAWGHEVGIVSGTPITLVAAIDVTAGAGSCFSFEIGEAGSTKTVIDVANAGAVTAKHAAFYLAPTGCQVGPFKIAAGFTIDFDGAIMGTPVHVGATVALDPFKVEAELSIGAFAVGGFELDHAHLQLLVSDTEQKVAFDAQATLFDASAKVSGEFHSSPDGVRVAFDGSFSTPDLGGFELKELTAHFLFTSGPPSSLSVAASADVKIMSAQVKANFSLEIVNGEFKGAHAEVENLEIGAPGDPIYVKGSAKIDIQPDTFPTIQIDGLLTASGRQLASAHLLVQPNGLAVTATLDIPGVFVVAPTISGTIAWDESSEDVPALKIKDRSGNEVDAKPGDFRFEVTDAAIQVEGVGVAGGVVIGYVGGVGWADMRADVHVAVGEVDLRVAFAGAIDTDGNFSLDGSGNLRLAGFDLANAKLHLVRQDGEVELSVDARLSIALATVELHGSLYRTPQGTMFELAGDAQIAPIRNYRLGATASFSLYRRPAGNGVVQGLSASTSLDLPTFSGSVGILITSDGVYSFSGNVAVRGTLGQALGWPRAQVDFYSSPSRTRLAFSASVANALGIPGRFSVDGAFDSSGRYSLNAVVAAGPWIWKLDIGICTIWAGAGGTFYLNIRGVGAVLEDARVGLDAWAGAGCGILSFSLAIDAGFWYQAPSTVHGTVRVVLDFGIFGQWKPVVYQM